ncbi:MAG: haloacid dehalogenase [Blastopirellula sp.]|nr:MAG: haloacid dehalogenase [Blastopirellula sp.]
MPNCIPGTSIEIVNSNCPKGPFQAALFDFDGTISLLRQSWQDVMIPMMIDILQQTGTSESSEQLHEIVENFVMKLNGKQTIYQMMQLAEEVQTRGAAPLEPIDYKNQYHDLLWKEVSQRIEQIKQGQQTAANMCVPQVHVAIECLIERGLVPYLASGTDLKYVQDEAQLLQVTDYFGTHIYAALDDYKRFSKQMIIQKIIQETGVPGAQIIGFGDGYVEIEEIHKVGGLAIGVASNEETREGINTWKRTRLIDAGADLIMADYREFPTLLNWLNF